MTSTKKLTIVLLLLVIMLPTVLATLTLASNDAPANAGRIADATWTKANAQTNVRVVNSVRDNLNMETAHRNTATYMLVSKAITDDGDHLTDGICQHAETSCLHAYRTADGLYTY